MLYIDINIIVWKNQLQNNSYNIYHCVTGTINKIPSKQLTIHTAGSRNSKQHQVSSD